MLLIIHYFKTCKSMYYSYYFCCNVGFNKDFTVHPGNLTVYENTERYAFKCHINMFAEFYDHLSLMRIEWDGAMKDSEEFQLQDSQFSFSPLPGYSIFVRDANGSSFDLFLNRYRCRAVFTLPNGSDITVATSKMAFLLDTEGIIYNNVNNCVVITWDIMKTYM